MKDILTLYHSRKRDQLSSSPLAFMKQLNTINQGIEQEETVRYKKKSFKNICKKSLMKSNLLAISMISTGQVHDLARRTNKTTIKVIVKNDIYD